jgi:radical SAM family uncharacterized protein
MGGTDSLNNVGSLWSALEPLLDQVQRPARYIGGEQGAQAPRHSPESVAWLLCYPDSYEIGLPNQGLQILYEILNERPDAVAERAYAPWGDLEALLRRDGVPLFSVDTHRAAGDFDVLAFNLSSELVYTNVLNLIDLAGVEVRAADRSDGDLLIGAGGHCAFNPEPLADFVDFFVLGDGEEAVGEITAAVADHRAGGRRELLGALSRLEGVYVPAAYEVSHRGASTAVTPRWEGAPETVQKRTIASLGDWPYPKQQLVPLTEVVHDRLNVEVFRGCTRGCRFCQAGMITRPVRERPADQVRTMISDGLRRTGYDEVALTSLSTADFSGVEQLVADVVGPDDDAGGAGCPAISVSLPSLRVDAFTVGIAAELQRARRTGLTFAPEAGSWRLRQVINKLISTEDLDAAVESAYSQGWRRVKLYFLVGLPTETDEDVLGIAALARRCVELGRRHVRGASVTVSVGGFVPKPQTPFQWFGQNTVEELRRKVALLTDDLRGDRSVKLKWHDPEATLVEGLASRGDRRLGAVIEEVWRRGGTFQEWSEHFDYNLWLDAMAQHGLSVEDYAYRHRGGDEALPWDHLSAGLHKDFLWQDWQDALAESGLEDCRWTPCYDCGACTGYGIEHVVASAVPPAGGSQGTGQDLARPVPVPMPTSRPLAGVS